VTALLAVTLVEEEITLSLLFGGILIFVGVYSVTKNNSR
jgi:drug/metabolite transporter (DMT)-like permease